MDNDGNATIQGLKDLLIEFRDERDWAKFHDPKISGAAVPGAEVSLSHQDGTELHTMASGADGEFSFTKIHPCRYLVVVNAKGFAPFVS